MWLQVRLQGFDRDCSEARVDMERAGVNMTRLVLGSDLRRWSSRFRRYVKKCRSLKLGS